MRYKGRERDLLYLNRGSSGGSDIPVVAQATPTITVSDGGLITASANQAAGRVVAGTKSATKQLDKYDGSFESSGEGTLGNEFDALIDGSITEVTSNVTSIGKYAFYDNFNLLSVSFPMATIINTRAFYRCKYLTDVYFPKVIEIGSYALWLCENVIVFDFPSVVTIQTNAFENCERMRALILRSNSVCSLASTSVFSGCNHLLGKVGVISNPNGDKDGYIYVPKSLIEDYKVATNWTTYASQFRAIEDFSVDGTVTGALDESKI